MVLSLKVLILFLAFSSLCLAQSFRELKGITIHNIRPGMTADIDTQSVDFGPQIGDILNAHYLPGLMYYERGAYSHALVQMDYTIARPQYTEMNPRQKEFFSIAHYIRGMVYFYHASGLGRLTLARRNFEQSIRWNADNHLSYLELARVYSSVDLKQETISTLQRLLALNPNKTIARDAGELLNNSLGSKKSK